MSDRLEEMFRGLRGRRPALITYATAFYPDAETSARVIETMLESGADAVEIGIPFSDPVMDGPVIQRSSAAALSAGATVGGTLDMVRGLRARTGRPLMLMTYYNPVYRWGPAGFARDAAAAGADCLVVPDLPVEESEGLGQACREAGLRLAGFCAPNTSSERMERISARSSGFLYCVSLLGTTGARDELPPGLSEFLARARANSALPLAVGVGISTPGQCAAVGRLAEGVIVGSALVRTVESDPKRLAALSRLVGDMSSRIAEGR